MSPFGFGGSKKRQLACKDAGLDCPEVFTGKNDDEVLTKAGQHAEKVHNMKSSPEMKTKLKGLIKNV